MDFLNCLKVVHMEFLLVAPILLYRKLYALFLRSSLTALCDLWYHDLLKAESVPYGVQFAFIDVHKVPL